MPNYVRGYGKLSRQDPFRSIDDLTHFLTKTKDEDWKHFQKVATDMMTGKRIPNRKLKKKSLHAIATSKPHVLRWFGH